MDRCTRKILHQLQSSKKKWSAHAGRRSTVCCSTAPAEPFEILLSCIGDAENFGSSKCETCAGRTHQKKELTSPSSGQMKKLSEMLRDEKKGRSIYAPRRRERERDSHESGRCQDPGITTRCTQSHGSASACTSSSKSSDFSSADADDVAFHRSRTSRNVSDSSTYTKFTTPARHCTAPARHCTFKFYWQTDPTIFSVVVQMIEAIHAFSRNQLIRWLKSCFVFSTCA